ncbi:hypothetical protein PanWU01x14_331590 [Parasponia andersonii]|uniref:Uncharacterized protein n=1 Tax=Parasponia andersonii TaxID=3476 RepID=A0A2P5AHN5_PARAD|nr:hypothetical protein PanWU01x14_331590 [Parasponia andersonii]
MRSPCPRESLPSFSSFQSTIAMELRSCPFLATRRLSVRVGSKEEGDVDVSTCPHVMRRTRGGTGMEKIVIGCGAPANVGAFLARLGGHVALVQLLSWVPFGRNFEKSVTFGLCMGARCRWGVCEKENG